MRYLILTLCALLLSGCAGLLPTSDLVSTQKSADQAYAAGQYGQAANGYSRLAQAMPTDAGVRYQMANSLARLGDVNAAISAYREALVRDPQHARAWHNLLQVQLREALRTASEMQRNLNRQQPHAEQALHNAEQLLRLTAQPDPDPVKEP